ncbi:MAG: hypothetical protein IJ017_02490 [Oscillospiraceae bacterium]|nr:hypothetical protein [Oscillospiraceae bacterium]
MTYKHNDPDIFHGKELSLHDCVADKITYENGVLSFNLPEGFWITTNHDANDLENVIRTDSARVDFRVDDILDVSVDVYIRKRNIIKRTIVQYWDAQDLIDAVNSGKCTIEFIYQYRTFFEQMWQCVIRSEKKPYYRECYLHIPGTEVIYRWNNLRPDHTW